MLKEKRVAITGGASGYGKALAFQFAGEGWKVALMDINQSRGAEVVAELKLKYPAAEVHFALGDVRKTESFETLRDELVKRWGGLDLFINNAGVAAHGFVEETPIEEWQWILDINLLSIVRSSQVFIPLFKKQGHGHIANVASMAGLLFGPKMGSYNISKAGVVALSETMFFELKSFGIKVSVVCPGFFQTNLGESIKSTDPKAQEIVKLLLASSKLSSAQIAAYTYKELVAGRFMILPHPDYHRFWRIKRYIPTLYYRLMEKRTAVFR